MDTKEIYINILEGIQLDRELISTLKVCANDSYEILYRENRLMSQLTNEIEESERLLELIK